MVTGLILVTDLCRWHCAGMPGPQLVKRLPQQAAHSAGCSHMPGPAGHSMDGPAIYCAGSAQPPVPSPRALGLLLLGISYCQPALPPSLGGEDD